MSEALDVVLFAVSEFNRVVFIPIFDFFDANKLILLLVFVYFTVRFLLAPLVGGRAIPEFRNPRKDD